MLEVKDRKLLVELDLNGRAGTSELGKKIGLSQEGTYYRLKRLEKNNTISGYITLLNFGLLGYTGYGVYARFQNVSEQEKQKIIDELKKHDRIYWIAEFGGKYDLAFAIMARSVVEFNTTLTEISTEYTETLKDLTVAIRVELVQFPRQYLLEKKHEQKTPRFGKYFESIQLDEIDEKILTSLAPDARISVLEIARKLDKPASTITQRIRKLTEKNIIQGYSTLIRCQEYGYQSFQLFVNTQNLTSSSKRKLYSYCQNHPNIIFFIETVGKWNFEIIYEVENQKEFQNMLIEIRSLFSEIIQDVESIVLFDHYVKYNQFPQRSNT